jgi:hypothetical protein
MKCQLKLLTERIAIFIRQRAAQPHGCLGCLLALRAA